MAEKSRMTLDEFARDYCEMIGRHREEQHELRMRALKEGFKERIVDAVMMSIDEES